ncbi:hypothetical protein QQS21_004244 [Conoideocrella luteorostrata]|uniref:Adenylate kinase n=1 Tax=Conoideocrella luteorostrata TaxID=1105319 RepID=A0AAJ0FUU8_9HYPO|nr:hypothetical protein QQS21_004244 [Conoideocrella luteorostrata]
MQQQIAKNPNEIKPIIIGLLGGPGSGKGTQCRLICQSFKIEHFSIGDVLRKELHRRESPYATIIRQHMLAGTVGPKELTIALLHSCIKESIQNGAVAFVLDGFPRNIDQLRLFESIVGPLKLVILIQCSEGIMLRRLLPRGRFDDQEESIRGRLRTFNSDTSQVIELFRERNELKTVNGEQDIESTCEEIQAILANIVERR